jgi:branched-chain amino acid transport system permease protein
MDQLLAQLLNGFVLGALYVLMALGLSIIFGMIGVVNFAHGVLFALGAYLATNVQAHLGFGAALVISPIAVALIGMLLELTLLRRVYTGDASLGLLLTFGLALIAEQSIRLFWGPAGLPFNIPGAFSGLVRFGPVEYSVYRTFILGMTLVLIVAIWLFLAKTPYGHIIRAGSRDPEMVEMMGVDLSNIFTVVFGIGALLAATAGVLAAPLWGVHPAMGTSALLPSFAVVVIGGLGSFWGAVIVGLLVGEIVGLTVMFWPIASDLVIYVLMALVLLLRPRGLLGETWERFD